MAREPTPRRADFSRGCTTADHRGHQLRGGRLLGRLVENDTTVELRNGAVFGADGQLCRLVNRAGFLEATVPPLGTAAHLRTLREQRTDEISGGRPTT